MVITKRYNSVERFTSMSLSESGVDTTATARPMSQQHLAIIPPQQNTWINHHQQEQQPPHSHIQLARRQVPIIFLGENWGNLVFLCLIESQGFAQIFCIFWPIPPLFFFG